MPRRRRRDERGASAVEFALVMPILFSLLFGIIEMGFLMRDYVSLTSAVRAGARTASAAADAGAGTCEASGPLPPPCTPERAPALAQAAADAIQKTGTALPPDDIDWVMIYEAGPNGYPIGQSDLTCGATNCVVYRWDKGLATPKFRYQSGTWDSRTVNACVNDANRDTVGVGMQATHKWLFGLFPQDMTMQESTIMQFEPLEADRCRPGMPNAHP